MKNLLTDSLVNQESSPRKSDAEVLRAVIVAEIKQSNLSREQIADAMTELSHRPISARQINAYMAASREDFPWPAELDIIFCEVIGSYRLLAERVKRAGFRMIGPEEERLIRIGKAWEQKKQAEKILAGMDL